LIDGQQGGLDLGVLEVFDDARGAALERDREDPLTLLEMLGVNAGDEPEEAVNGGQSDIPGRGPVAPGLLTVVQKGDDDVGRQGVEIQLGHRPPGVGGGEPQQEGEAVSIAADGVGAGAADLGQVLGKKPPERRCERRELGGGHGRCPAGESVTSAPQVRRNRRLAASARADTNGR
jgi:hypothetical protein